MNKSGGSDLLLACSVGDLAWLKRGLPTGEVSVTKTRNPEGLTCLHLTAKNGHLECMKYLLDNYYDIDVNDIAVESGNTALHYSISTQSSSKNFLCMKLLLDRGANICMKNKHGQTVLHIASKCGDIKCLKYLLKHGSDFQGTDNDGYTALKYASLHCHHECARLLQALYWVHEKERATNETLLENESISRREHKTRLQEMQMKKEQAEYAYNNWLERKASNNAKTQSPHACRRRLEARKQSDASTCVTCTKVALKKHITRPRSKPIKLNTKQVKRNLKGVGKPDEMHQYSNSCFQSPARSHSSIGSSHVTRGTSLRSSRTVLRNSLRLSRHTRSAPVDHSKKQVEIPSQSETHSPISISSKPIQSMRNDSTALHIEQHKTTSDSDSGKLFTFGPEETGSDEEDSLFHDVGDTNNLESLALPNVVTKGKTPVEVLQLFRRLSTPSLNRSSSGKNQHHRARYQRRFSLGSIPEGRIVTNYAEDMSSDSQLLDTNFLEELIRSFSNNIEDGSLHSKPGNRATDTSGDEEPIEKKPAFSDDVVYSVESEESLSSGRSSGVIEESSEQQDLLLSPTSIEQHQLVPPKKSCRPVSPPNSLKIVNLAWNSETDMVESQITVSPFAAQKHVGVFPTHKTPSPGKDKVPRNMCLSTTSESGSSHVNFVTETIDECFSHSESQVPLHISFFSKRATSTRPTETDDSFRTPVQAEPEISVEMKGVYINIPEHRNLLASKSTLLNRPVPNSSHTVVHKRIKSAPHKVSFM